MPRPTIRHGLILLTMAALTAAAAFTFSTPAVANLSGDGGVITSSDGSSVIRFEGGATLNVGEPVHDAAWAQDGSRAVFVTDQNELDTVRYNDPGDLWTLIDANNDVQRSHPVLSGADTVYWAEKPAGAPWEIEGTFASYGWSYSRVSPGNGATLYSYTHPDINDDGVLVAQRQQVDDAGNPIGNPDVVKIQSGVATVIVSNAASPALLLNTLAFVRSDGTHTQIYTADITDPGDTTQQITSDAYNHDDPAWNSATGYIYFSVPDDGTVGAHEADSPGGTSTLLGGLSGVPAFQPTIADFVSNLAGANRFTTAVAISRHHWMTAGGPPDGIELAQSVTLSRSDTFADAVSGSALAAAKHGPLLLTRPTSLSSDTAAEMQRVLGTVNPGSKTVYLLGGTGAISADIADQIADMGYHVVRLGGANRYATSIAIAHEITDDPSVVMAATGMNFPDALGAGAAAGAFDSQGLGTSVVVLTNDKSLPSDTKTYLDDWYAAHGSNPSYGLFGIGGQASAAIAAYPTAVPLIGANRYETAQFVAQVFFAGPNIAGVTIGSNWPDALAGGAFLGSTNGPLLLTDSTTLAPLNPNAAAVLSSQSGSIRFLVTFGGLVPASAISTAEELISGPDGTRPLTPSAGSHPMSAKLSVTSPISSGARLTPAQMKARALALHTGQSHE